MSGTSRSFGSEGEEGDPFPPMDRDLLDFINRITARDSRSHRKGLKRRRIMVNSLLSLTDFDRFFLGFDRLHNDLANMGSRTSNYPRYNIIKGKDKYRLEMDLAGWDVEDIEVVEHQGTLTVEGTQKQDLDTDTESYIYKGISGKRFKRQWTLGKNVRVDEAGMNKGLLVLKLKVDIPESEKPKLINIK